MMDAIIKLIEALSSAAWPAIFFFVVWSYRRQFAALIESARSRKFSIEVGGQKLSMEEANQQQQKLIEDLQKQLLELRKKVEGFEVSPSAKLAEATAPQLRSNLVLWVDDHPKNNSYFIELLQKRGYRVDTALSSSEALAKIGKNRYGLILSDMGRTEMGQYIQNAGIELLEQIQKYGLLAPYVVFSGRQSVDKFHGQLKAMGGRAITSSSTELRAILDELAPNTAS